MEATALTELGDRLLAQAGEEHSGRAAVTVHGGRHHSLRQTVIALTAGAEVAEHESPGEATLHVLRGQVRLTTESGDGTGTAGDLLVIPPERHGLSADEDSVVLLTVVKPA